MLQAGTEEGMKCGLLWSLSHMEVGHPGELGWGGVGLGAEQVKGLTARATVPGPAGPTGQRGQHPAMNAPGQHTITYGQHTPAHPPPPPPQCPPSQNTGSRTRQVRVRVTEVVEPVLVLEPSLVSRADLSRLASKQQASSKQAASTLEMGKNHSSVVVLRIRPNC